MATGRNEDQESISQQIAELARSIKREHGLEISKIDIAWVNVGREERRGDALNRTLADRNTETERHIAEICDASLRNTAISGVHFECSDADWTAE